MATRRRRSSNNDDIRARLGIEEAPEPEPEPTPEPASEDTGEPAAAAPGPAAADYAHEDYAAAVAEPEDAPVEAPKEDWRDDGGPVEPVESNNKIYIIAAVVALLIGLGIGTAVGKVTEANLAVKRQVSQAQTLEDPVNEAAKRLALLNADLDTMLLDPESDDFASQLVAFNQRLSKDLTSAEKISLSASSLKGSLMVLADGDAGPRLTDLVSMLSSLEALVKQHEANTLSDQDTIEREIAGTQDDADYAVIFNVKESQKRFGEHTENPEESNFEPVSGIRVTLPEVLEIEEQKNDYFYNLRLPNGQKSMIPIYAVISLPRNQLVASSSTETATNRFMVRSEKIKDAVEEVARAAKSAQEAVETVANR